MNINQQNQIESYLSGRMSPEELAMFESTLDVNPELQQELQFQQEVIQGIGHYRKMELKARLDAINVASPWWTVFQPTNIFQFFGGAAVLALITTGAILYFNQEEPVEVGNSEAQIPVQEQTILEDSIEPEVSNIVIEEQKEGNVKEEIFETQAEKDAPKQTAKAFEPTISVPKVGDVESEKEFIPDELPTPKENKAIVAKNRPIEVEVIDSRTSKIKYRYYAGKLYLYGNFSQQPYEILEINSAKGRRIYLYYMEAFYEINQTDKAQAVEEVTDVKLVHELSILRKTK